MPFTALHLLASSGENSPLLRHGDRRARQIGCEAKTEPDGAVVPLYLTPAQARRFAAALVRAADAAATEASYRASVASGGSSLAAPARVPPLSA